MRTISIWVIFSTKVLHVLEKVEAVDKKLRS